MGLLDFLMPKRANEKRIERERKKMQAASVERMKHEVELAQLEDAEAELAEMRRILPDLDEKKRREAERRLSELERQLRKERAELRMKIMRAEWKSKDAADEHSHALFMQTIG